MRSCLRNASAALQNGAPAQKRNMPTHRRLTQARYLDRTGTTARASGSRAEYTKEPCTMKFVLVNHRVPLGDPACSACSKFLRPGYIRDVATRREYCGYDCYRRSQLTSAIFPLLSCASAAHCAKDPIGLGVAAFLAAASCWLQVGAASISWINAAAGQAEARESQQTAASGKRRHSV